MVCGFSAVSVPTAVADGNLTASCTFDGVANTAVPVAWLGPPPPAPPYQFGFTGDAKCVVHHNGQTIAYGVGGPPATIAILSQAGFDGDQSPGYLVRVWDLGARKANHVRAWTESDRVTRVPEEPNH